MTNDKTNLMAAEKRARAFGTVGKVFIYIMLVFWALMVLFPFYYMILTSLKSQGAYNSEFTPKLYTLAPTLENFRTAFSAVPLGDYFLNTLIFTLLTTAIMLVVSVLAAFAFARLDFPGKSLAFTFLLSLMMIPSELVVTIHNRQLRGLVGFDHFDIRLI